MEAGDEAEEIKVQLHLALLHTACSISWRNRGLAAVKYLLLIFVLHMPQQAVYVFAYAYTFASQRDAAIATSCTDSSVAADVQKLTSSTLIPFAPPPCES